MDDKQTVLVDENWQQKFLDKLQETPELPEGRGTPEPIVVGYVQTDESEEVEVKH